jgi:hypothetical protein
MGNQLDSQTKDPVLYPSISPSHIASCVRSSPRSRPIRVSCHESHPLAVRGQHLKIDEIKSEDHQKDHTFGGESLQESSLHSQSHHDRSRNFLSEPRVSVNTKIDTVNIDTGNIDTGNIDTDIDTINIDTTSDKNIDTSQEGYTYIDLCTERKMFNRDNLDSCCNNCRTIKTMSPLPKSSNKDTHSDAKEDLEKERIHTETALTASIDWLSMSEPCFETLTEADQAMSRLFYSYPTNDDGEGCKQQTSDDNSRVYNQQTSDGGWVLNQQTSDDNSRPYNQQTSDDKSRVFNQQNSDDNDHFYNSQASDAKYHSYMHQTSEGRLIECGFINNDNAMNPSNHQNNSNRSDKSLDSDIGYTNALSRSSMPTCSKSLITDTSMGQNGHWRQDAGAQQPDEEPCDLIEVSRQSLFANPRTGEQYIMVYGSSDVKDTFHLTGSEEKTSHCSKSQKSSESTDGFSNVKNASPGDWSIFKLSPTEHESGKVFHYECEVGECLFSERTSGFDLSVGSHITSSYGPGFEEQVPNNDSRTVETLQRIIHEHSNGNVHVQAQSSTGEVYEQIQSVPCSFSELTKPFHSTNCKQTCQCQEECIDHENLSKEYSESTFNNKHSTTAEETCVDQSDHNNLVDHETYSDHVSLVGHSKPYETYSYNSDHMSLVGHSKPYETYSYNSYQVNLVGHSKPYGTHPHNNDNKSLVGHSKSHELQAHNSSHNCLVDHSKPQETQAHNSDHNKFADHPAPPAYSRWPSGLTAANPQAPSQSLPNNPFTTQYKPSSKTQSDQNKRRALYQNRRGLSINSLDLNSVATLPAANLIVQHGHCVACRTPSKRSLYLQDIMPVSPSIDSAPTTTQNTDTTTNRSMYKKSLSADDAGKLNFEIENKFPPAIQTLNPLSPKMPPHCKIDDAEPDTHVLNFKNCGENGVKKRSISNESSGSRNERLITHQSGNNNERQMAHRSGNNNERQMTLQSGNNNERQMAHRSISDSERPATHRSISNNERQMAHRSVNVKYERHISDGSCDNLGDKEEIKVAACHNPISRVSAPPMRSISQKNYLAYLCCAADNLTSFGLPFHRKLEAWGLSIFLAERDLELSGPKYDNMAKCVEESCNGKVIVILSKSYASSDDCLFLTNFAKTLDPDSKRKNIIPVLIDKDVEIPNVLQGVSLIKYNYVCKHGWLKDKLISALAA